MRMEQLETPALVVDLDIMEENMRTMDRLLEGTPIRLRPHYKSHKCPAIAKLQLEHGAKGICCAKLSEAEDLILSGVEDVLIANQITAPAKIARLAVLAGYCDLTVCVDDADNVDALQAACGQQGTELRCLVEYDIGMNRCGVKTKEEVSSLARHLLYAPNLIFEGIQAYAGNLAHEEDTVLRKRESEAVEEKVRELKNYLEDQGISVKEVSGISTGTIDFHGKDSVYTEAQCGSYLFSDTSYRKVGVSFRNALSVLATVVSARPGAIVTDAGVKSLAMDQRPPVFTAAPELSVNFSEEHSAVYGDVPAKKPGDIIRIIPGHCCTTVNLYDWIYLVRDGQVVDRLPVTGRGRSQ